MSTHSSERHDCYFGDCPECGRCDGYVNVRQAHFGLCKPHRVFWPIGWNLFSSWQEESEDDWKRNEWLLASCRRVKPVRPAWVFAGDQDEGGDGGGNLDVGWPE